MKKKIDLKSLQVQSFVTSLDEKDEQTVKGGSHVTGCGLCDTYDDYFCQTIPGNCIVTEDKGCASYHKKCSWGIICEVPIDVYEA